MNKQIAIEWLKKVYHDLGSAKILYEANHYTDTIGVDLHYAIEKSLKTFLDFADSLFQKVCAVLMINIKEIILE